MARKKIVFVIVEGPSDDDALGLFFDELFDQSTVHVEVMHCDITTQNGSTANNINKRCYEIIHAYAEKNHYKKEHFQQIIHLVDTDGTFVPSDCIVENTALDKVQYFTNQIVCKDKEDIIERNAQKSSVIKRLINLEFVWSSIPYHVYFMSSNLDHVLYNQQNSTDAEKECNSLAFSKKYREKTDELKAFLAESDFSVRGDYRSTWDYIMHDKNSLMRHTNISLCFPSKPNN